MPLPLKRGRGFAFYLTLLLVFAAGVLVDRAGLLPGSAFHPGAHFQTFWEAWNLVEQRYVDRSAVNPERMREGAILGMLASLGDVGHTGYLTAEQFSLLQRDLKGKLYGIGARISIRKKELIIVNTFPDSPARQAGVLPGDKLIAVNGHDVRGMSLQKVVEMVRGEPGTTVHLRVVRKTKAKPLEVSVQRGDVSVPQVTWQLLPGPPIVHLAIQDFGTDAAGQLRTALEDARKTQAKALIIDVRGNPGGLKDQAVEVVSEFVSSGTVFIQVNAKGERTPVPVKAGYDKTSLPLCVLIDEGTASAAEIFAGAIQDHHRGKLVGTKTFGTGTVLQPFRLSDGSVVLLAVDEWLTPDGRKIWHEGIKPDVEITLPENAVISLPEMETNWTLTDLEKAEDRQLRTGWELLKKQIDLGKSEILRAESKRK